MEQYHSIVTHKSWHRRWCHRFLPPSSSLKPNPQQHHNVIPRSSASKPNPAVSSIHALLLDHRSKYQIGRARNLPVRAKAVHLIGRNQFMTVFPNKPRHNPFTWVLHLDRQRCFVAHSSNGSRALNLSVLGALLIQVAKPLLGIDKLSLYDSPITPGTTGGADTGTYCCQCVIITYGFFNVVCIPNRSLPRESSDHHCPFVANFFFIQFSLIH